MCFMTPPIPDFKKGDTVYVRRRTGVQAGTISKVSKHKVMVNMLGFGYDWFEKGDVYLDENEALHAISLDMLRRMREQEAGMLKDLMYKKEDLDGLRRRIKGEEDRAAKYAAGMAAGVLRERGRGNEGNEIH